MGHHARCCEDVRVGRRASRAKCGSVCVGGGGAGAQGRGGGRGAGGMRPQAPGWRHRGAGGGAARPPTRCRPQSSTCRLGALKHEPPHALGALERKGHRRRGRQHAADAQQRHARKLLAQQRAELARGARAAQRGAAQRGAAKQGGHPLHSQHATGHKQRGGEVHLRGGGAWVRAPPRHRVLPCLPPHNNRSPASPGPHVATLPPPPPHPTTRSPAPPAPQPPES